MPCYVSHIDTGGSERIIGVELKYQNMSPIYVIGAYLPAPNNRTVMDTLSELDAITSVYSSKGKLIIAGDFNAQLLRDANSTGRQFKPKALGEFIMRSNVGDMAWAVVSRHYGQL